jgi:type I restriction enzyme S subunit
MGEWKEHKLGTLATVKGGKRLPKGELLVEQDTGHPYIRVRDFGGKWIPKSGLHFVTPEIQKTISRYTVDGGDVILSIVGSIGFVARISPELNAANLTENCVKILPDDARLSRDFLYYFLKSDIGQGEIDKGIVGSTQPKLPLYNINNIEIALPDLPEQKAIAEVLSSLDDKIDLLHRQNKTLERLAETLFRQWFIEEAEEKLADGTAYKLGDLIDTISDTFKFTDDEVIFLNTSDIYGGTVLTDELSSPGILPGQAKKRIKKNDILYSEIRPANKRYAFIDFDAENYVVSTKLMVLRAKPDVPQAIIYFYLTHPDTLEWLQMIAESRSGTFPQITFDQVKEMTINFPDEKRLGEITEWAESTLQKISRNREQIQTLAKLRDDLLPKLMGGHIRVD